MSSELEKGEPVGLEGAPDGYGEWLTDVKARVHAAQQRAALAVSQELLGLYWQLGRDILERQAREGWGAKVVDRLARDLRAAFPEVKGFSPRNLKYMRRFAEAWPDLEVVQQLLHKVPWFHLCTLLDKVKDPVEREWYLQAVLQHGWSRNVLVLQIETEAYRRQGKALTNFEARLPRPQSDLARETLKDPYRFDFLRLGGEALERDIESALIKHVTQFLLELGAGFAFVGRQVLLTVAGDEFFVDLLFYHLKLRCYVVIEIKAPGDAPTIGLLLCKSKNKVVAEYALRSTSSPMGVAEYQLVEALPKDLEASLPSVEQIERELGEIEE